MESIFNLTMLHSMANINAPCTSKDLVGMPPKKLAFYIYIYFFSNMIRTWLKLKAKHDDGNTEITANSPLWNNNDVQYKKKKCMHEGLDIQGNLPNKRHSG